MAGNVITVNTNNPTEVRIRGLTALKKALGTAGAIKFMQQFENGYGDYTKEKYTLSEKNINELDKDISNFSYS